MPDKPRTPCIECGVLCERGQNRCAKHRRLINRARPSPSQRGYDREWEKIRARQLRRFPLCQYVERNEDGIVTFECREWATEVDHDPPLRVTGSHRKSTLTSYCKPHHSKKTQEEKLTWPVNHEPPAINRKPRVPRIA